MKIIATFTIYDMREKYDERFDLHCGGGVIHRAIPQDYFDLQYDEFLEKVIALAGARKYNFTIEDLKDKEGLKEFFNQNRDI